MPVIGNPYKQTEGNDLIYRRLSIEMLNERHDRLWVNHISSILYESRN